MLCDDPSCGWASLERRYWTLSVHSVLVYDFFFEGDPMGVARSFLFCTMQVLGRRL